MNVMLTFFIRVMNRYLLGLNVFNFECSFTYDVLPSLLTNVKLYYGEIVTMLSNLVNITIIKEKELLESCLVSHFCDQLTVAVISAVFIIANVAGFIIAHIFRKDYSYEIFVTELSMQQNHLTLNVKLMILQLISSC